MYLTGAAAIFSNDHPTNGSHAKYIFEQRQPHSQPSRAMLSSVPANRGSEWPISSAESKRCHIYRMAAAYAVVVGFAVTR
jgi:hypothetical protein